MGNATTDASPAAPTAVKIRNDNGERENASWRMLRVLTKKIRQTKDSLEWFLNNLPKTWNFLKVCPVHSGNPGSILCDGDIVRWGFIKMRCEHTSRHLDITNDIIIIPLLLPLLLYTLIYWLVVRADGCLARWITV